MTLAIHKMGLPKVQSLACRYQFKTPLLLPGFDTDSENPEDDGAESENKPDGLNDTEEKQPPAEIVFSMGTAGVLTRTQQKYTVEYEDGSQEDVAVSILIFEIIYVTSNHSIFRLLVRLC